MKKKLFLKLFLSLQILHITVITQLLSIPLFDAYPDLKEKVPYVELGKLPTPIKKLENLGKHLGVKNLYIKQDNFSGDLFGGNKVRKLEFLLGAAQQAGATGVITTGSAGSNLVAATAAYAHKLDMTCYALLIPQNNAAYLRRNLLLMHHYNAILELLKTPAERTIALLAVNKSYKEITGNSLFVIPKGGSDKLGTLGFVNAAFELKKQIEAGILPEPNFIYIARGTMGSSVGLALGLKAAGLKSVVVPVADEFYKEPIQDMISLFKDTNNYLRSIDPKFQEHTITEKDLALFHGDFYGKDYAHIDTKTADAIKLMYTLEDIKLDGTYTGKACAAMLHDIHNKKIHMRENNEENVILFWNSYCSENYEEITKAVNYKELPIEFHKYFETGLQALDQGV